ncbi:MAG: hypothetical protein B7733_01085 [Myxococcales bacterium FL481]|nr:MAG: hypothetical protein B7733_01085 [Myxococcales bacterium FL481]
MRRTRLPVISSLIVCLALQSQAATAFAAAPAEELSEDEKLEKARGLFGEAQDAYADEQYGLAADKFEQAYFLVPAKHGFAHKVGIAAYKAGDCQRAEEYLKHFLEYGDGDKHPDKMSEAKLTLGEISATGCADKKSKSKPSGTGTAAGTQDAADPAPIDDQPELTSRRATRAEAAAAARDQAERENRGPLFLAGFVLTGVGVLGVAAGVTTLVMANNTATTMADLSAPSDYTGFPTGDYSLGDEDAECSSDVNQCPYLLGNRLSTLNYITPIALGAGGAALAGGATLLILERRRRKGGGKKEESDVALQAVGPMFVRGGAGAAATLRF